MSAEETLKQSAITRKDEVMMRKISGEDLIAKEAHYHEECRKGYINKADCSLMTTLKNIRKTMHVEVHTKRHSVF